VVGKRDTTASAGNRILVHGSATSHYYIGIQQSNHRVNSLKSNVTDSLSYVQPKVKL
jgi:hypothetical protein